MFGLRRKVERLEERLRQAEGKIESMRYRDSADIKHKVVWKENSTGLFLYGLDMHERYVEMSVFDAIELLMENAGIKVEVVPKSETPAKFVAKKVKPEPGNE